MIYALWHTEGRNLIGTFDTESEVLDILREAAERHGREYLDSIALVQEDNRGRSTTLAMGADALTQRIQAFADESPLLATKRR